LGSGGAEEERCGESLGGDRATSPLGPPGRVSTDAAIWTQT
jgi:hypothetical protein